MNPPDVLTFFYKRIVQEATIGSSHISLFMALYQLWRESNWTTPLRVHRKEVMRLAKISSSATFHKCLKQLIELKCISYQPTYDPKSKSKVYLQTGSEVGTQ